MMKSMREINLDTYSLSLLTAKEDILNPRTSTNWALFAYDGIMNRLKLADSGVGGLRELMTKLHPRRPLYGMCRVETNQSHIIMILWVGNEVDEYRRAECASHLPAIRSFFREVKIFLPAHTLDEITEERICSLASKAVMVMQGPRQRLSPRREDRQDAVGTNYKRTIAAAEILKIQRDSFWAQSEREENERKKDEQQRAAEDRRQREMERFHQERREAVERERKMMEREQKIKEQRRIQAQMEAEERRQERIKWKHQEKERKEDETRARNTRSESEEKAAEAAALVSQRTVNPREFFRQLSSSSLNSVSQPTSPNPGRSPYRQQHHSQTDNIFIFNEPSSFTPPSPYRSRAVSPHLPSPPTSQSPTLVFPNSLTSFLHSPAMTSPTISKQHVPQEDAIISCRSLIQTSYEVTARPTSQIENQLFPLLNMNESEIKSPITAIIDSLVFYPLPLNREELQSDNQVKTTDELLPASPDFELPPKPSEDLPEDSMQTQPDISLFSQNTSDSPVCTSDALTSSPPPSSPVSLVPSCLPVPQPPSRPLPALPVTPQTLNEMESKRDFSTRVSVISTVEEELEDETEREDKERVEKIHEECEMGEGKDEVTGCEEKEMEDGEERVKMEEQRKENIGQKETDGRIMEKHIVDESESELIEEVKKIKVSETEKIKHGESMTECENVIDKKNMEESESKKDQEDKIMEETEKKTFKDEMEEHENEKDDNKKIMESEKYEEEKIMEESESEKYKEEKIMEESESEKYQEEKIMEESESEKYEEEKIMEESESEKYQEEKIMEESESEKYQEEKIMEEHENEKYQEEKIMEEHENEKYQEEKIMEESESDKYQEEKIMEESESEKYQEEKIMEESESEKYQEEKIMEKHENEKCQEEKIMEEHENEKYQEEKIMEESESEKYQEEKIMEESENEKYQEEKIMEESESENCQEEKIMEESESEKYQEEKIMEESESEKYQEEKIMEESESEKYQEETIMQKSGSKKSQDENKSENQKFEEQKNKQTESDSEKDRKDKGDYQEKHEQALKNQETSSVDFNMTINPTVLKAESDTQYIMTDEGVKKMISGKLNDKEERNTEFMKIEETVQATFVEDDDPLNADKHDVHERCSETLFSQHAPVFPESSASTPEQYSHESTPEDISDYNENEPQMNSMNKTSDISESQSDGQEELEAVKQFIKGQDVAGDSDVSNDPTNEKPDAVEREKASLIASNTFEAGQDSNRQHLYEAKQYGFSQNCETPDDICDCKKSDVSCTVGGEITDNC